MAKYYTTKYTSNEQYEKDKAKFLEAIKNNICVSPAVVGSYGLIFNLDFAVNMLKQSKWIGAFDVTAYEDGYQAGYIDGANDKDEEDG